ncbi:hypothetical protein STRDD10_01048 [Streptococcus sp. DD10]|uniref:DUF4956 domain-containing protein n=1 Tax=Streptococcus sp. DD10 TaxID=1777878 RepID=UPI000798DB88|nr:DUF4956 domain-containing protein [Streptococcus sp. DD10]KXT74298.1 hypothetical protein STRDD10_01048 [Streptococcus sp. DD10]
MSSLFNSIFNNATTSVNPLQLLFALLVSLGLGMALAWTYKYRTLYTREFVISLTLLPSLMTLVIFLVNGSLGTSIAVAGTFSLIRFRSATSGSRELIAIFLAMIIGLAAGTGYLLLAILSTIFLLAIWLLLETQQSRTDNQRRRHLTVTVDKEESISSRVQQILESLCTEVDLISVNTSNGGDRLTLTYEIDLQAQIDDFQLTDRLITSIDNCDVALTKKAKKKKNL